MPCTYAPFRRSVPAPRFTTVTSALTVPANAESASEARIRREGPFVELRKARTPPWSALTVSSCPLISSVAEGAAGSLQNMRPLQNVW